MWHGLQIFGDNTASDTPHAVNACSIICKFAVYTSPLDMQTFYANEVKYFGTFLCVFHHKTLNLIYTQI